MNKYANSKTQGEEINCMIKLGMLFVILTVSVVTVTCSSAPNVALDFNNRE